MSTFLILALFGHGDSAGRSREAHLVAYGEAFSAIVDLTAL